MIRCKLYVFISTEGYTYQPDSVSIEPDIENCQVIGFSKGRDIDDAFENLLQENIYLIKTTFNEIVGYELKHRDRHKFAKYFYLNDRKKVNNCTTVKEYG